ncbi:hypothetical protein [Streptomyces sp. A1277]|uniref:hypothetical protein n=1 Tax=Streptomyces sp. A1277 TaxID=2563103 RepID=UPI0023EF4DBA|nr:hypothetical protein [Streptomyces sp. A1277]
MSLHRRLADSPSVQAALADASILIDSASLHLMRSASAVDAAAESSEAAPCWTGPGCAWTWGMPPPACVRRCSCCSR